MSAKVPFICLPRENRAMPCCTANVMPKPSSKSPMLANPMVGKVMIIISPRNHNGAPAGVVIIMYSGTAPSATRCTLAASSGMARALKFTGMRPPFAIMTAKFISTPMPSSRMRQSFELSTTNSINGRNRNACTGSIPYGMLPTMRAFKK